MNLVQVEVRGELHVDGGERVDGDDGEARADGDQAVVPRLPGALPVPHLAVQAGNLVLLREKNHFTFSSPHDAKRASEIGLDLSFSTKNEINPLP